MGGFPQQGEALIVSLPNAVTPGDLGSQESPAFPGLLATYREY